jgi:hypothetical protein
VRYANYLSVVLEHLPHDLFAQAFTPRPASAVHWPENVALRQTRRRRPGIDRHLDPRWQRGSADPAVLANKVDNAPPTIALLNMRERECRNLRSPQTTAQKNG